MTRQTEIANSLVGSPAGFSISRLCTLTLTAISGHRRRQRLPSDKTNSR